MQPQPNLFPERSPPRRVLVSYSNYAEAQRAVDYLSDKGFAVQHTAIVAEGLKIVEQVTGRLDLGRAALNGALSGGTLGVIIGLFLGLFSGASSWDLALRGALFGLVFGAISGAITYALTGGRRDFTSVRGMQADKYNVMVDDEVGDEAALLLEGLKP